MWIVQLALRRTYTFVVMALLIAAVSGVAIYRMPTDIFPEINIPVVSVVWQFTLVFVPVLYTVLRRKPPTPELTDDEEMPEASDDSAFEVSAHPTSNNRLVSAASEILTSQEGRS
jgi:hypothetical protein